MRLEKYITRLGRYSRSQIRILIKKGEIFVNDRGVGKTPIDVVEWDTIRISDEERQVRLAVTILINKPAGYVCSNQREWAYLSRKELIDDCPYHEMLEVAGRLDQDTTGLLVASSDGQLIHRVISPRHKLPKTYRVHCRDNIAWDSIKHLEQGVILDDGYTCLPAHVECIDERTILLTICEWKYHQVKRMLEAVQNQVTQLERITIGNWRLTDLQGKRWVYV
jgi:16S rRNA pseudouridine516 synthase